MRFFLQAALADAVTGFLVMTKYPCVLSAPRALHDRIELWGARRTDWHAINDPARLFEGFLATRAAAERICHDRFRSQLRQRS